MIRKLLGNNESLFLTNLKLKRMKFKLLILLLAFSNIAFSQIPDYYNDVNLTLTGQNLKDELANKVTVTHTTFLSYTPGVWDALKIADLDPNNSSKVILIYGYNDSDGIVNTDRTRGVNDNGGGTTDWNREHVYPKSLGIPNLGTSGPGADAHHLRPSDVSRNSNRGSRKFADGSGNSGTTSEGHWYPGDEFKGDVARMMMYMYIRYGSVCLPTNVGTGTSPASDNNMLNLFLEWNVEDPVSDLELQRNPALENIQGNRNPFIDNPAFATTIWGGLQAEDRFGGSTGNPGGDYCLSAISSFPYNEDFESSFGGWDQSTDDDFDWSRLSGATPSSNTGPSAAYSGSNYLYMESSTPNYSTKKAIITSPCYSLRGISQASFSFRYHLYGSTSMGNLKLEATSDGNNWITVWSESGNLGNSWNSAEINLASYLGGSLQLRFNGVTGTTWQGDMAIDAIALSTSGSSGGGANDFSLALNIVLDDYPEETSWEIRNSSNIIVKSGGTYVSRPDGSLVTVNMTLEEGCYDLVFKDAYGDGICCSYGFGSYSLVNTSNSVVLASGGSFGSTDTRSFCLGSSSRYSSSESSEIEEIFNERILDFYPNPAKDFVKIRSSKDTYYKIISQTGKVIKQGDVEGEIDLSTIESGVYMLMLSDGKTKHIGKLVKK